MIHLPRVGEGGAPPYARYVVNRGMTPEERRKRAGTAVAARIADLHTTAPAVARRAGIDARTLRNLINGKRWPRQSALDRLNEALHWPAGEIGRRAEARSELKHFSNRELIDELCRRADGWPREGDGFLDTAEG